MQEQMTLFGQFDQIENSHENDLILFESIKLQARFLPTKHARYKRRIDLYCATRGQLEDLKMELFEKGWIVEHEHFPYPAKVFL